MSIQQPPSGVLGADILRLAVAASGDLLFVLSPEGEVLSADGGSTGAFGVDPAAAVGRSWPDFFHEADRAPAGDALRIAADGGCARVTGRVEGPDGTVRHWRSTVTRAPAEDGRVRLLAVARDVSEEAALTATLDRRERLHRALKEATAEIVWHLDLRAGRCDRHGFEAFTGHALAAEDHHGWLAWMHPDDRDRALTDIDAATAARRPYMIDYRFLHRSGEWRMVEDHGVPLLGPDGEITDWIGIITDIHDRRRADEKLRRSEQRLRLAIEATGLGTWDVDVRTGAREWSDELKAMLGLPPEAVETEALLLDRVHPDDRADVARHNVTTFLQTAGSPSATFRVVRADTGAVRWIKSQGRVVLDEQGRPLRRIGTFQDVTEQHETRLALKLAFRRHQALIAATSEIVWHTNAEQNAKDGNGWTEFTGQSLEEADGRGWLAVIHPDDRDEVWRTSRDAMEAGRPYSSEYRLRHVSGEWRWVVDRVVPLVDEDGRIGEWVGIIADIHKRKTAEEAILRAARTDDLTGLANRALFHEDLERQVAAVRADGRCVGLILIDLDHFKEVNDSLGHDAGDHVLTTVADRLRATLPAATTIARLGGDEFGVLLPADGEADVTAAVDAVLEALRQPLSVAGRDLDGAATLGYAIHPLHDPDPSALLKNADIALYAAKHDGRGQAFRFAPAMRSELDRRVTVLRNARRALATDAIVPVYQPKVSLADGRVVGFEALLRWRDDGALRSPASLQEAFADAGLSARLGACMLAKTTADMAAWTAAGVPYGQVAINVAAPEFHQPSFVPGILGRLAACGLPPSVLEIEVTESVLLESGKQAVSTALRALHAAGVAITLDDFGTGYASLTHLKKHPVSWLKIDRSFVSNLETDRDSAAIVQAVLGMARNIGIRVVAEGVETRWQRDFLARNACDVAQGFLIARPMPAGEVPLFLSRHQAGGRRRTMAPGA
ncbi:GGDEF and EAL domain-containing protein [Chthonobacter rhizosphaerae]|uniref:GGDEF and EAL domain-containing protein n=1 Tax=Chthonobacter rhizosphaerae TaxID=2735553 RepID=UPI0015EE5BDE|nr:GGDEF and EAL domain-containing protein [Chthonobacter rhizosphaerae]